MNIIEARQSGNKFTGSAVIGRGDKYWYVNNEGLILDDRGYKVPMHIAFLDATDYELYEEGIRPKEAGELWFYQESKGYYHTEDGIGSFEGHLVVIGYGGATKAKSSYIVHGQDGWQRIHPPVEDERVEIEGE